MNNTTAHAITPVEGLCEGDGGVPRPPDDQLGGQPAAPAQEVHLGGAEGRLESTCLLYSIYAKNQDITLFNKLVL